MKNALKWIFMIAIIACLAQHIHYGGDGMLLIIPVVMLFLVLMLMKQWFPQFFNILKKVFFLIARSFGRILWQKPERKGGATVRSQKIRWRK